MSELPPESEDLAARLFKNSHFILAWFGLIACVLVFVAWPIRNFALVCWVYGSDAYFQQGIRVLPGRPVRFSNGQLAPGIPDTITAFGAFLITVGLLTASLLLALRLYERWVRNRTSQANL
jgi:hypothetical protein